MKAAIISKSIDTYQEIKKYMQFQSEECDYYKSFEQFKYYFMLCYDYLVIHHNMELSEQELEEIKNYCRKKNMTLLIYESDRLQQPVIDFENEAGDTQDFSDQNLDTIELRPKNDSCNPQKVEQLEVIKTVYSSVPQQNICVTSLSRKAGSTFIAINLAKALSDKNIKVAFIEMPFFKPYVFDYLGLQQRLLPIENSDINKYLFIQDILNNRQDNKMEIVQDQITWLVTNPMDELVEGWDSSKMIKLLHASIKASVNIVDIGIWLEHTAIKEHLKLFDKIFVIVDPLPPDIMQNEMKVKKIREIKKSGYPIEIIINKHHNGINTRELIDYIGITPIMSIPFVDIRHIYRAVYNCKIPYTIPAVKRELERGLMTLIEKEILQEVIHEIKGKKSSLKKRIF